jgi:hypothetical protein
MCLVDLPTEFRPGRRCFSGRASTLSDMQPTKPSVAPYASAMKKSKGRRRDIEGLWEQFATDSAKPIPTEVVFLAKIPEHIKQMAANGREGRTTITPLGAGQEVVDATPTAAIESLRNLRAVLPQMANKVAPQLEFLLRG